MFADRIKDVIQRYIHRNTPQQEHSTEKHCAVSTARQHPSTSTHSQGFETLQVLSRVSHSPPTTFSGQLQLKLALAFATAKFGRHVPPFLQGLGAVSQRVVHFLPSLLRGALLGHPQVLLLLEVLLVLPLVVVVVVLTQTPVSQSEGTLQNCPNLHFVEQLPPPAYTGQGNTVYDSCSSAHASTVRKLSV